MQSVRAASKQATVNLDFKTYSVCSEVNFWIGSLLQYME